MSLSLIAQTERQSRVTQLHVVFKNKVFCLLDSCIYLFIFDCAVSLLLCGLL